MSPAYAEKYLRIDLQKGDIRTAVIAPEDVQRWLMGSGLAARLFHQSMDSTLDPLDPASPLLVFNGLLTGTIAPAAARSSWCGRSPLTGIWNEANVGGHWGGQLRAAGYAGIVITGRARSPVWLWIEDDHVQIRDAAGIWGSGTFETQVRLRELSDPHAEVATIGLAGENLVRIAGIMSGGQGHNRAAGRGGMGALMGSKNLKAIVVRGSKRPDYPDAARARASVRAANERIRQDAAAMSLSKLGTAGGVPGTEATGDLPLKNWQEGSWPAGALATSGQAIRERMWVGDTRCFACPIGCGKEIRIDDGPYGGVWGEGPEYETLAGFGGNLLIDDLEAIAAINQLCNDLGLDTISSASVTGFATEAVERRLIDAEQADMRLAWGDPAPVLALLPQIAQRQGLGALLADGVRAAARRIGPTAEDFALHVKGLELPYHDPRGFVDMGLNYATASRGACHLEGLTYWRGYGMEWPGWQEGSYDRFASDQAKVETVIAFQDFLTLYNPLGLCKFIVKAKVTPASTAELVNALTGWEWSTEDLLRVGERLFNLKRLINLRLGITRADDTLPTRLLEEPRPSGSAAGVLPDLSRMLPLYYRFRGWDAEGRPTRERLEALSLSDL